MYHLLEEIIEEYKKENYFSFLIFEDLYLYNERSNILKENISSDKKIEKLLSLEEIILTEDDIINFLLEEVIPSEEEIILSEGFLKDVKTSFSKGYKEGKEGKKKEDKKESQPDKKTGWIQRAKTAAENIETGAESFKSAAEEAKKTQEDIKKTSKTARVGIGVAAGAVAMAALISSAAYIYNKSIDKCRGLTGNELIKCRRNAARAAILEAERRKKECNKTNNPKKCEEKINKKIDKYKDTMETYSE